MQQPLQALRVTVPRHCSKAGIFAVISAFRRGVHHHNQYPRGNGKASWLQTNCFNMLAHTLPSHPLSLLSPPLLSTIAITGSSHHLMCNLAEVYERSLASMTTVSRPPRYHPPSPPLPHFLAAGLLMLPITWDALDNTPPQQHARLLVTFLTSTSYHRGVLASFRAIR